MSAITQEDVDHAFSDVWHSTDCERIAEVIRENFSVHINLNQAEQIWQEHSDSLAANWLHTDDNSEIISAFETFISKRANL